MKQRVVVTGMGGITPLGDSWESIKPKIQKKISGISNQPEWSQIKDFKTTLAGVIPDFEPSPDWPRKKVRTMGRVSLLSTYATSEALARANYSDQETIQDGSMGVSYGSTYGSPPAFEEFMHQVSYEKTVEGVNGSNFIKFMSHTCAANLAQFFETKGRIVPSCCACTAGSQGIGFGYEAVKYGLQEKMICGGADESHYFSSAVFDVMYATSTDNDNPTQTPKPFDKNRDGLVVGEGAATLILESLESAQARGAEILAEVAGYATTCDGAHMVNPSVDGMRRVMELALQDAGVGADEIDYVNMHGTATEIGDIHESKATFECFQRAVPVSSLKSYMGHTLGACGAIEAWLCIEMMREGWIPPTMNLSEVDPECAPLDYVTEPRELPVKYFMSNNFAFGGVNTSIVFKKWDQ